MKAIKVRNKNFFIEENNIKGHINHWNWVNDGTWEPRTFEIFDTYLDKDHSYIDFGAWIGSTVLYGAQTASHVYAVEPDPIALKALTSNINVNPDVKDKITLFEGAISASDGRAFLDKADGGSVSTLIGAAAGLSVDTLTFASFLKKYQVSNVNFIKMDIEGSETIVLPQMKDYLTNEKPVLYISLHPWTFNKRSRDNMIEVFSLYKNYYDARTCKSIKLNEILSKREVLCL